MVINEDEQSRDIILKNHQYLPVTYKKVKFEEKIAKHPRQKSLDVMFSNMQENEDENALKISSKKKIIEASLPDFFG